MKWKVFISNITYHICESAEIRSVKKNGNDKTAAVEVLMTWKCLTHTIKSAFKLGHIQTEETETTNIKTTDIRLHSSG